MFLIKALLGFLNQKNFVQTWVLSFGNKKKPDMGSIGSTG